MHGSVPARMRKKFASIRGRDTLGVLLISTVAALTWYESVLPVRAALAAIDAAGGRAYRNHRDAVYAVRLTDADSGVDDVLPALPRVGPVEKLSLSRSVFEEMELASLPSLRELRALSLHDTQVSDQSLPYIGACRRLELLSLDGTDVTSSGIAAITALETLRYLSLARTDVDDRAVAALSQLEQLDELDLRRTKISREGLRTLRLRLPHCRVTS